MYRGSCYLLYRALREMSDRFVTTYLPTLMSTLAATCIIIALLYCILALHQYINQPINYPPIHFLSVTQLTFPPTTRVLYTQTNDAPLVILIPCLSHSLPLIRRHLALDVSGGASVDPDRGGARLAPQMVRLREFVHACTLISIYLRMCCVCLEVGMILVEGVCVALA